MRSFFAGAAAIIFLSSCAQLHHVQVGDIHSPAGFTHQPFDIKISETGVNIQEAKDMAKIFMNQKEQEAADSIAGFIALFQVGPRTGNPVYTKDYAKSLIDLIYQKCPSGNVTGLSSIRETRKYPVVSGEIVKITGFCLIKKGG